MPRSRIAVICETSFAVLLVLSVSIVAAFTTSDLSWHVVAGGGGRSDSLDFVLHGTAGQPAVDELTSADYRIAGGF